MQTDQSQPPLQSSSHPPGRSFAGYWAATTRSHESTGQGLGTRGPARQDGWMLPRVSINGVPIAGANGGPGQFLSNFKGKIES